MPRKMSQSRKTRIFVAANGICHICGEKIDGVKEKWDAEHVIPYELTRDDSDDNIRPAHKRCHTAKTKDDVKMLAKVKRVAAKHQGARRSPSSAWGTDKFKRKVGGGVEPR
jgi:5-methylcytosine-specific restriction endonuclease McrA